jgi:hypothetical protein
MRPARTNNTTAMIVLSVTATAVAMIVSWTRSK